ncbi:hypothetical protein BGX26_004409 [Mortierella sp. AD094]|nr:hypothetical protein BGX26_004409 [Mortierella sp. AD094]
MSDKELLAQIAQVAGAINKHMNSTAPLTYPTFGGSRGGYGGRGRGRGRGMVMPPVAPFNRKLTLNNTASPPASPMSWSPTPSPVFAPVAKPFVRPPVPSRHLSLVNSKTTGATGNTANVPPTKQTPTLTVPTTPATSLSVKATSTPSTPSVTSAANNGQRQQQQQQQQWIQSKGKNMSMMNPASYKKTMEAKMKSIRSSKEKKLKLRQAQAKLASDRRKGIITVGGKQYSKSRDGRKLVMRDSSQDNIVINGVSFEMDPRGNKLVRRTTTKDSGESSATENLSTTAPTTSITKATPKQFSMGGVVYVRTRNGNLVRATLVQKQLLEKRAAHEALKAKQKKTAPKKPRAFCKFFTRFGQCSRGPACPFVHSRTHLAICKKFLRGNCPNDANTCHLSHTPSPHTTPACSHFQRAACNKDNCLYPHIRINPQAPICRPFATEGWCETGINCKDRHVWICPDFGTPAGCKKKCGLAHVANGGIRVKRSAEEMEKERQEQAMAGNGVDHMNGSKRKRMDSSQQFKSTGRYMDNPLDQNQDLNQTHKGIIGGKRLHHDEDFVPFDLGEEEDAAYIEQDESEVMGDFEGDQEEEEEEDDEDVSSDEVDDEVGVESEDDDEGEDAEEDSTIGVDSDSEEENDDYDDELERFYEEQDREHDDF